MIHCCTGSYDIVTTSGDLEDSDISDAESDLITEPSDHGDIDFAESAYGF